MSYQKLAEESANAIVAYCIFAVLLIVIVVAAVLGLHGDDEPTKIYARCQDQKVPTTIEIYEDGELAVRLYCNQEEV